MKHRPAFLALTALSLYFGLPVALSVAADQAAPEPSMAGAPAAPGSSLFQALDTNKDGFVSRDEAKRSAEVSAGWKAFDTNGDSRLSPEELGITTK